MKWVEKLLFIFCTVNVYIQAHLHGVYVDNETHLPIIYKHLVANGSINTELNFCNVYERSANNIVGQDGVLSIATRYRLDVPAIQSPWRKIFRMEYRPWGPPSLLYNEYWVPCPGVKWPGHGIDHPHPSSAKVKERVQL
jgi:hypothetical protein